MQWAPKSYKTVAITSGKGGVGKSTLTANLAVALTKQGLSVGVLDADIYGPSQSGLFGALEAPMTSSESGQLIPIESHGIHFVSAAGLVAANQAVVWRAPMVTKLITQFLSSVRWPEAMDILLLDLPPGTGDIHITLCQKAAIDGALLITTPQHLATQVTERGLQMLNKVKVPVWGLVENMRGFVCEHCGRESELFYSQAASELARRYELEVLGQLPLEKSLSDSAEAGEPVLDYAPDCQNSTVLGNIATRVAEKCQDDSGGGLNFEIRNNTLIPDRQYPDHAISAWQLRNDCPCAMCVDEHSGQKRLDPNRIDADIRLTRAEPVGRYGIRLHFSDGHNTGIYQYHKLCEQAGSTVS